MKAIIREETIFKKRTIYRSPKKVHRRTYYRGNSKKIKRYSEEEKIIYLMEKMMKLVQKLNELMKVK